MNMTPKLCYQCARGFHAACYGAMTKCVCPCRKPVVDTRPPAMEIKEVCKHCIREAVKVPVVIIPIVGWPTPVKLQARFALCVQHTAAFTLNDWTDFAGGWYEMVCDQLREKRKPAENPYPDDPDFKWEEWIIDPNWHAAPRDQCRVEMYDIAVLQKSRGMRQKLW